MSTIFIIVVINALILVGILFAYRHNIKRTQTVEKKKYVMLGIFLSFYFTIPLIFNIALSNKWYSILRVPSRFSVSEWFSFLGGYVGNIGTIIFGWIAFWQAEIINKQEAQSNKQQEQIKDLQNVIIRYQALPTVEFKKASIRLYHQSKKLENHRKEVEDILFKQYGKQEDVDGESFLLIGVDVQQHGLIPVTECFIDNIEWKIAGKTFVVELQESHKCIEMTNYIDLVLDKHELGVDDVDSLLDNLVDHFTHEEHGMVGYDKSEMILHIKLQNELGHKRQYQVWYRFNTKDKENEQIVADRPHVKKVEIGKDE